MMNTKISKRAVSDDTTRHRSFNAETQEALAEYEEMKAPPETYKRYKNFADLLQDIDDEI